MGRREDKIRQVRSLDALARGASTEHERELASRRADDIARRYSVTNDERFVEDVDPLTAGHELEVYVGAYWFGELMGVCAWALDCIFPYRVDTGKGMLVGPRIRCAQVLYVYRHLELEIKRGIISSLSKSSPDDFAGAAVIAITRRMKALKRRSRDAAQQTVQTGMDTSASEEVPDDVPSDQPAPADECTAMVVYRKPAFQRLMDEWRQRVADEHARMSEAIRSGALPPKPHQPRPVSRRGSILGAEVDIPLEVEPDGTIRVRIAQCYVEKLLLRDAFRQPRWIKNF